VSALKIHSDAPKELFQVRAKCGCVIYSTYVYDDDPDILRSIAREITQADRKGFSYARVPFGDKSKPWYCAEHQPRQEVSGQSEPTQAGASTNVVSAPSNNADTTSNPPQRVQCKE
jgi:hypothetical protein